MLWARLELLALGCKGDGNNNISRSASVDRCNEKIAEILVSRLYDKRKINRVVIVSLLFCLSLFYVFG